MTAREIDIHTLPSMLTALRLPSFHKLWAEIATRADNEGWPACGFRKFRDTVSSNSGTAITVIPGQGFH